MRYDTRVLGRKYFVTNDTRVTGLNNNDLVVGGSGSGKTGGIIYPTLRNAENESFVFIDSKGLMSKMLKSELQKKGYDVHIISFIHPELSEGYNPLDYVGVDDSGIRYQDIVSLSSALMPALDNDEPIWEENSKLILQFLLAWCFEKLEREEWNMNSIVDLYHILVKKDGLQHFIDSFEDDFSSFAAKKLLEIEANIAAEKMFASTVGFVNVALAPYSFPEMRRLLGNKDRCNLSDIANKKSAVFIQVSDVDRTYDSLVSVFMTQAMNTLISIADVREDGRLPIPCRLYFDDMASNCVVPEFAKIISVIRSRDIYVSIILQSLSQLYAMYNKHDAVTIVNNCDHIIYMSSNDIESVDYICSRANKTRESILTMDRTKEYVLTAGEIARLIDKHPAYSDVEFN